MAILPNSSYKILFTLINGSTKQFHQLCKHICNLISMNYSQVHGNHNRQHAQQIQLQQQQRLIQQVFIYLQLFYSESAETQFVFSVKLRNFTFTS